MPTDAAPRARPRWSGLDPADRRAGRRALLIGAAFELLGGEGLEATTVRAVCQHAPLNPRYFYESFESLDELLVAVYDDVVTKMAEAAVAAMASAPDTLEGQIRGGITGIVRFVEEDRRRGRILYVEALGNEALARRRMETGTALVELLERDGVVPPGSPSKGDPIGRTAAAFLVGGFAEIMRARQEGRIKTSRQQLIDDATELFLALSSAAERMGSRRKKR